MARTNFFGIEPDGPTLGDAIVLRTVEILVDEGPESPDENEVAEAFGRAFDEILPDWYGA